MALAQNPYIVNQSINQSISVRFCTFAHKHLICGVAGKPVDHSLVAVAAENQAMFWFLEANVGMPMLTTTASSVFNIYWFTVEFCRELYGKCCNAPPAFYNLTA
jgi:hypothetical protein